MEEKNNKFMDQAINDEILEKLSLKNRYQFLNTTLMTALEPNQLNFLKKAEKFCIRYEKKNNITPAKNWIQYNGLIPSNFIPPKYVIISAAIPGAISDGAANTPSHILLHIDRSSSLIETSHIVKQLPRLTAIAERNIAGNIKIQFSAIA